MRNLTIRSMAMIICLMAFGLNAISQQQNLNIPNDLCFTSQPSVDKAVNYNVTLLRNECINIFASNPNTNARKLNMGATTMANNARSSLIAPVRLTSISTSSGNKSYNFGPACGEAGVDDANVIINYTGNSGSTSTFGGGNTPFRLLIPATEILTVTGNNTPDNSNVTQDYLKVEASSTNTATISIATNVNQGQVIIAIFLAQGNPNPVALIDPKSTTGLSYTTDEDVFVVPLIRPKLKVVNGVRKIVFEVGDPEENGTVDEGES